MYRIPVILEYRVNACKPERYNVSTFSSKQSTSLVEHNKGVQIRTAWSARLNVRSRFRDEKMTTISKVFSTVKLSVVEKDRSASADEEKSY